ncbi:MAG: AAA family ATPase [Nanoarchaeota archaeon]|nr:AAA family ATPase [Nanoarchaeota archaeon]
MINLVKGINLVYGESATGKTTLAMQACLKEIKDKKKVVFIDTEKGFSIERIKQMDRDYSNLIKNVFLFSPKSFIEQHELIKNLSRFDFIVVDTIGNFYRIALKENHYAANARLDKQLRILKELNCTVLITNQVYFDIDKNKLRNIGENILFRHVDNIIKLERNPRTLITKEKLINFKICDSGIVVL